MDLLNFSFNNTHIGEAMNIEEYAPAAIPTIRGVENSLTVGTNILTAVIVISVDADVYIDLFNVSFIPLFAISVGTALLIFLESSLILSNITIVSFIE